MIKVKVKYFGRLRELLGVREEEYNIIDETTLADLLLNHIPSRHRDSATDWKESLFVTIRGEVAVDKNGIPVLKNHVILVRGKTQDLTYMLRNGDEIAILPPVGGGANED